RCPMVYGHARSRGRNEPNMPVNSFTCCVSAEFSFTHCAGRNFRERQFTCLSLLPMNTLTKHNPVDGMKPPLLSFGCIASLLCVATLVADDAALLAGKWSVKKVNDEGQKFTQTIEITPANKFVLEIVGEETQPAFLAHGHVK